MIIYYVYYNYFFLLFLKKSQIQRSGQNYVDCCFKLKITNIFTCYFAARKYIQAKTHRIQIRIQANQLYKFD